jgi:hypothetical protein
MQFEDGPGLLTLFEPIIARMPAPRLRARREAIEGILEGTDR